MIYLSQNLLQLRLFCFGPNPVWTNFISRLICLFAPASYLPHRHVVIQHWQLREWVDFLKCQSISSNWLFHFHSEWKWSRQRLCPAVVTQWSQTDSAGKAFFFYHFSRHRLSPLTFSICPVICCKFIFPPFELTATGFSSHPPIPLLYNTCKWLTLVLFN